MKKTTRIIKLVIILLLFVLSCSLFNYKTSYGVYRQTLRTTVSLSVVDPSTLYDIEFDNGDGDPTTNTHYYKVLNSALGTLPTPTKAGYNFAGWYTDNTNYTIKINPKNKVAGDVTYYAKWVKIICEKATASTLHHETCRYDSNQGCKADGLSGQPITYGSEPGANTYEPGDAYNCDVNNDGTYDPDEERFYFIRENSENNSMVLYYYTSIDENGVVDTQEIVNQNPVTYYEPGSYYYTVAQNYHPLLVEDQNSSLPAWDNPGLILFDNIPARLVSLDDIEVACGTLDIDTVGYLSSCPYLMENSRYQDNKKGRAGIWVQKPDSTIATEGYRLHTGTRTLGTVNITSTSSGSYNQYRPTIEIPVNAIEDYPDKDLYTISFETGGGSAVSDIQRAENEPLGTLPEPTKTGYEFVGWYMDANYVTPATDVTFMPDDNITLHALWQQETDNLEYVFRVEGTCVFNGEPNLPNNPNYITSPNNNCIGVDKNGVSTNYTASGNERNYIDTGIALFSQANADKDFELGFTIDSYVYNAQSHNQSSFVNSKLENSNLYYPGFVIRKSDKKIQFTEKFNNVEGANLFTYTAGMKIIISRKNGVMYYAQDDDTPTPVQDISNFNQYFNLNTWFGAISTESDPTKDGVGSSAARYITATLSDMYIKLERDIPANSHRVEFIFDGGTLNMNSVRYVADGSAVGTLPTVTRNHYTFDGWYEQNGSVPITAAYTITSDINFYAHFTPDSHTVTFDNDGGIPANSTMTVDFNEALTTLPSTPTKDHFTFGGWYTDNTWTEQVTTQTIVTGNVTFIAKWIPDQHTITFDSDGGVPATYTATVNYGEMIGQANMPTPNPTKTNMTFSGWYTDNQNYTTQVTANTVVYGNTIYYAKWTQGSSLTVTFNVQDGDPITPNLWYYSYGDLLDNLPTPTRQYFQFVNWYSDSDLTQLVDATTAIYTDMELYAKWEVDPLYVARIGNVYYTTLADAVAHVPANTTTTITIVKDISLTAIVNIDDTYDVIVDIDGHDLDTSAGTVLQVQSGGQLTIKDTAGGGTISGGLATSPKPTPVLKNLAGGILNIQSGTVTSNITNVIDNTGTMNVTGGLITIGDVKQGIINNNQGAILNVSGGQIKAEIVGEKRQAIYNEKGTVNISGNAYLYSNSTNRATLQNYNTSGVINITGGTIISANANCQRGAIQNASGSTVNLISGTVISNSTYTGTASGYGPGGIQNEGTLVIGNNSDGIYDVTTPVIQAKKFGINLVNGTSASNVYMYDGIIKSVGQTIKNNYTIPSANTMSGTSEVTGETEEIDNLTYNLFYYELISGYTVTFNAGSGQAEKASMKFPENATVSNLPTATWAGHIFDGWYTPQNQLVVEGVTVVDQDITYTAHWLNSVEQANMTNSSMTLTLNGTESIGVTNANSIESFTYSSNDPTVATVNSSGVVTAVGPGKTQIALTGDRSGDIVHALVTVNYSNDIPTFDIMPTAMRNYFNNIDIWAKDQTDASHTSYDNYMSTNLSTNNCVNFGGTGGDDRSNKGLSSGSTFCDVPNQYDTGVTGNLNVYEYNPTTNTNVADATYVTVNNGKIYNVIPGKAYYWESVSDSTVNGKFYAYGERRIIQIDNLKSGSSDTYYQTRNVRDLGGIPVEYVNASNQTVTGTIKYEKLYRGEKIWGGSGASLQYFTKLGINHEMDLRGNSEPVTAEEDSFADAYKIRSASKTYEIIHYGIDYTANSSNYNLARGAVVEVMNAFINDPNYSLYFHCRIGADRTGTLAYLLEGLLGASNEDMYRDYEMTVFFGLDERTRFYYNKGDNTTKFVYMKQAIRNASQSGTDEDVLQWFLKGSSNQAADMALVQQFRSAMVDVISVN